MKNKVAPENRPEALIEDAVMANTASLGYEGAGAIRRVMLHPGQGVLDLVLLPEDHRHKLVIVEAKHTTNKEGGSEVVGQLLNYYASALNLGNDGLQILRKYMQDHEPDARAVRKKTAQLMCGGIHRLKASPMMSSGDKLFPGEIGLIIAIDGPPKPSLTRIVNLLQHQHTLPIRIVQFTDKPLRLVDP